MTVVTYSSPEHLAQARARVIALGNRIQAVLNTYENRKSWLHHPQSIAGDYFNDHTYRGGPAPSDAEIARVVKEIVTGPPQADARATYNSTVTERERALGRALLPEERLTIARELGLRDERPAGLTRDTVSQADVAAARKRYEDATGKDFRHLLASEQLNLVRVYRDMDRAAAPQTPVADRLRAEGKTEADLTVAERLALSREGAAS